jgi:hypothetical protein
LFISENYNYGFCLLAGLTPLWGIVPETLFVPGNSI